MHAPTHPAWNCDWLAEVIAAIDDAEPDVHQAAETKTSSEERLAGSVAVRTMMLVNLAMRR